jgi:glycosyltransferase involved in cell wall biosynthesis
MKVGILLINPALTGESGWIAGLYYVKNLLNMLARSKHLEIPEHVVIVKENFQEELIYSENKANTPWLNVKKVNITNVDIDSILLENQFDVILTLNVYPEYKVQSAAVGWIPDFQHKYFPEFFSEEDIKARELQFTYQAGFDDLIFFSSMDSLNSFKKFYPAATNKAYLYNFVSTLPENFLKVDPTKVLQKYSLPEKFIYLPNQFWKHKNHITVLKAWKILKEKGINISLVLTGNPVDYRFPELYKSLMNYITENELSDVVRSLGFISREDQIQLYRSATCILQPSLFEGWSTSVEEGKMLKKFFIASDIDVHKEQITNGVFFNKLDPEDLAVKVENAFEENKSKAFNEETEAREILAYQNRFPEIAKSYLVGIKMGKENYEKETEANYLKRFLANRQLDEELVAKVNSKFFDLIKQKEEKILEQEILLKKQDAEQKEKDALIEKQDAAQKEKDALLLSQDAAQKEKDALIHKHHKFAHELMDELKKRNIQFTTQWPSE